MVLHFRTSLALGILSHEHLCHGFIFLANSQFPYAVFHEKHTTCRFFFRLLSIWLWIHSKLFWVNWVYILEIGGSLGCFARMASQTAAWTRVIRVILGVISLFKEALLFFLLGLNRPEIPSTSVHARPFPSGSRRVVRIVAHFLTSHDLLSSIWSLYRFNKVSVSAFLRIHGGLSRWCVFWPRWLLVDN
jgi:hypothetical protein